MKQRSHLAIVGFVIGLSFTILSSIRYFLIFYDLDRALSYSVIGVLIMAVAFLYERSRDNSDRLTKVENYLGEWNLENKKKILELFY